MGINNISLDDAVLLFYNDIFSYCRRRVIDDNTAYELTQMVFLALSENYLLINNMSIRKWLYTTAHNKIVDFYRRKKIDKENLSDIDITDDTLNLYMDFSEEYTEEEIIRDTKKAMASLNPDEKRLYDDIGLHTKIIHRLHMSNIFQSKRFENEFQDCSIRFAP